MPGGFQGLEVFVRLEEGAGEEGVEEAEEEEEGEDVVGLGEGNLRVGGSWGKRGYSSSWPFIFGFRVDDVFGAGVGLHLCRC